MCTLSATASNSRKFSGLPIRCFLLALPGLIATGAQETSPPNGPLPSSPTPSSPGVATAGDDPTFIGSDGDAYHVLGDPWKYFNIISSPSISINAQFLPVKSGFVHGKITDTVLGTLHLAVCDAATGRTLGVLFDVFSGEYHCTITPPNSPLGSNMPAPCASALATFGVSITEEGAACSLHSRECGHLPVTEVPATQSEGFRAPEPLVPLSMGRFNVSVGGARISLLRDLIDRPEPPMNCAPLAKWAHAHTACEALARAHASSDNKAAVEEWQALPASDRLAVLAYHTNGNATQQMHFYNVRVENLPYAQRDVHGLLGQRAVGPVPPIAKPNSFGALDGTLMSTEQLSHGAGTTIRAAVAADGAAPQFQGEGAIEGSYRSYQVKFVSDHGAGSFAHTRFKCAAPSPVEAA